MMSRWLPSFALFALTLAPSSRAFAQDTILEASWEKGTVSAHASLDPAPASRILSSIKQGFRAEIDFQFRLYRREKRLFSFLGDLLVQEKRVVRVAYLDPLEGSFVMETAGSRRRFTAEGLFLSSFCTLSVVFPSLPGERDAKGLILLARITLNPVRVVAPLNIISLFFPRDAVVTSWVTVAVRDPVEP